MTVTVTLMGQSLELSSPGGSIERIEEMTNALPSNVRPRPMIPPRVCGASYRIAEPHPANKPIITSGSALRTLHETKLLLAAI